MAATPPPAEPPRARHIQSTVPSAQIQPTDGFKPHQDAQITATVGVNPDPPAVRSKSVAADAAMPLTAGSPTGFSPFMNQY
jgi:hypothetical protein